MKVFACLVLFVSASVAFPQAKSGCGTNERGVARKPGDNWQEQCNRCRCLESGVPGCTKKFCGSIPGLFEPASKNCKDSDGNIREEGALWEENGSGEVCTCGKGVVLCTSLQPVTDNRKTKGTEDVGVRFPGAGSKKATCIDANGNTRKDGDSWKEDCNTCGCSFAGKVCTQAFCVNIGQDIRTESTIFREDTNKDVSRTAQCNQDGVSNCRAVTINSDFLVNQLRIGEAVKFLPGINISMKLRRPPTGSVSNTLSYSFSLSDGGEASLTIRPRSNSVFASIRPITGSVTYSVESCGSNCNVLYERDINYFNQFQD